MPRLLAWSEKKNCATIEPLLPVVTCSMQATYLTGVAPSEHGIVGNGWYFKDECEAPDFARTVDIHRKPGYDPAELFIDPNIVLAKLKILGRLAQKRLGFRTLLDVIPIDADLVHGSHGRAKVHLNERPVLIGKLVDPDRRYRAVEVFGTILEHMEIHPVVTRNSELELVNK